MFGSNVGDEPIAYTSPLTGLSATNAPAGAGGLFAIACESACWPAFWRSRLSDSLSECPAIGLRSDR